MEWGLVLARMMPQKALEEKPKQYLHVPATLPADSAEGVGYLAQ